MRNTTALWVKVVLKEARFNFYSWSSFCPQCASKIVEWVMIGLLLWKKNLYLDIKIIYEIIFTVYEAFSKHERDKVSSRISSLRTKYETLRQIYDKKFLFCKRLSLLFFKSLWTKYMRRRTHSDRWVACLFQQYFSKPAISNKIYFYVSVLYSIIVE